MKEGLKELLQRGVRFYTSVAGTLYIGIRATVEPSSSFYLNLLTSLPSAGVTEALTIDSAGNMGRQPLGGGGTVTSFSAGNLPPLFAASVATATTTPALSFALTNQAANRFFAGPATGVDAAPTFRALVWADASALAGNSATSFAVGNDSRFHTQNTDTGTSQTSFLINSGGTGVRLKDNAGALELRNAADTGRANLIIGNLTVTGTTTTVNAEEVTIDDNIIVLNNNVTTGTPTEDGGVQVRRGASVSAALIWDETNDLWKAGLAGSELALTRFYPLTFTSADLVANVLTVNHNLGRRVVGYEMADNSFEGLGKPDKVTFVSTNQLTIDMTSFNSPTPITGSWSLIVWG